MDMAKARFYRCRLERLNSKRDNPTFIRDWVHENAAALNNEFRDQNGEPLRIVSIDRGTWIERIV